MWQVLRSATIPMSEALSLPEMELSKVRIGVPRDFFFPWLQPDVLRSVNSSIDAISSRGVSIFDVPWPDAAAARACAFLINRVETAAVHEHVALADPRRFAQYGTDLRLRIAEGRGIPSCLYVRAMRARSQLRDSMADLFARFQLDALLTPTLATTALPADRLIVEQTGRDESVGAGWTRLTMPFNTTCQPVLALPCGLDRHGLPMGLQLAGRPGDEQRLFQIGRFIEDLLEFDRSPPLRMHVAEEPS
jgi:aspartyl-tRNA(Asn)/glutamyl-tRNA(Gln) amidotransferase subunit A